MTLGPNSLMRTLHRPTGSFQTARMMFKRSTLRSEIADLRVRGTTGVAPTCIGIVTARCGSAGSRRAGCAEVLGRLAWWGAPEDGRSCGQRKCHFADSWRFTVRDGFATSGSVLENEPNGILCHLRGLMLVTSIADNLRQRPETRTVNPPSCSGSGRWQRSAPNPLRCYVHSAHRGNPPVVVNTSIAGHGARLEYSWP
jgi:hypothetical protein